MTGSDDALKPFEAILYPNPPLGRYGFFILMLAVAVVSAALGAAFLVAGAWPVTGYFGLDWLLLYLAFRYNQRASRRLEIIRLDQSGLHVRRVDPGGRTEDWRFEPYWVRVGLDGRNIGPGGVTLSSHGQSLRLGQFLTSPERRELAHALRQALTAYH